MKLFNSMVIVMCVMMQLQCDAMNEKHVIKREKKTTMVQSVAAGAGAGFAEVGIAGQVCSYFINQMIRGNQFSLNFDNWSKPGFISLRSRHVYSGVGVNLLSMGPITACQNGLTSKFQKLYKKVVGRKLSDAEKIVPPVFAGALTAFAIVTPTECIPNYMQKVITECGRKLSSKQALLELIKNQGVLAPWRGVTCTALRDGFFTVGYKTLPKLIKKNIQPIIGDTAVSNMTALLCAGVATALATQPLHVVARHMQNDTTLPNSLAAALDLCKKNGIKELWKGGLPRGARVIVAIPVLSSVEKELSTMIDEWSSKD